MIMEESMSSCPILFPPVYPLLSVDQSDWTHLVAIVAAAEP